MPLSKAHKDRSRGKILKAAGRLFRKHGRDGVGIDAIMGAAGLTRGGFYAHFPSKEALFAEVIRSDHGLLRQLRHRQSDKAQALSDEAIHILEDYLTSEHLSVVRNGCTFAALTSDAGRSGPDVRRHYGEAFGEFVEQLSFGLEDKKDGETRAILAAVLSLGGVMIASAVGDQQLQAKVLDLCRKQVTRELSPAHTIQAVE